MRKDKLILIIQTLQLKKTLTAFVRVIEIIEIQLSHT